MRLAMTSAVAFAATLSLWQSASASPLNWPDEDTAMALHCAAVLQAYGNAYAYAVDLTGQPTAPAADLPAPLLQMAGGAARLPDIASHAAEFTSHAESVARTSFYPALIGDGTPYLDADGRELVTAVQSCVTQYGL
jgi:hypothetical protein